MNKQNQVPIYLRITIGGRRFEWSTQRYIDSAKWSQPAEKVKGTTEEAKRINAFLELMKHKVFVYQKELILEQKTLTLACFKDKWNGITEKGRMIMETFRQHNEKMEALVGTDYAEGTLGRYRTTYEHTANFINGSTMLMT